MATVGLDRGSNSGLQLTKSWRFPLGVALIFTIIAAAFMAAQLAFIFRLGGSIWYIHIVSEQVADEISA